jgi:hypothetical protein
VSKPVTTADVRGVWSAPAPPDRTRRGAVALLARDNEAEPRPRTVELATTEGRTIGWGLLKKSGPAAAQTPDAPDTWLIGDCEALRARGRGWLTYFPQDCAPYAATRKILGFEVGDAWLASWFSGSSDRSSPSHWNGRTWNNVRSPASRAAVDLWGATGDDVWFVGGHDVVRWDGRALTALAPVPGLGQHDELTSVWGSDASNVWVAAYGGAGVKVARWDGAGWQAAAWFQIDLPRRLQPIDYWAQSNLWPHHITDSRQVALWGTAADDVWLAGPNGIVVRFDGRRWQRVATPTRHPLFGLGGTRDHVIAVGATGTILELDRTAPKK